MQNRTRTIHWPALFVSLTLTLGVILALTVLLSGDTIRVSAVPALDPAELYVCPSGCSYSSIQAAVDAASDGDVIKVAAGTYTDMNVRPRNDVTTTGVVTQVVYISKTVAIRGGYTTTNWTTSNPVVKPPMWTRPSVTPT